MSELCRFHGIVIRIFAPDHPPPHFHAVYAEYEAQVDIRSLEIIEGHLDREDWFLNGRRRTKKNWCKHGIDAAAV